ncbi:hypothetical protein [Paenibacillus hexagrammi]|uniref:Uncharacterized protein n=1 Tax=Paenibacillus hexagrammi TaxID=2908839 RepID=A0ABY3SF61_9BACL|nr:hypothetical protein [Paenibacillus sp. YPD9-1]UJF31557.1 hypothetical protein L0M14_17270 [Paenibacillus sp. YPD9-1]
MKRQWKTGLTSIVLGTMIIQGGIPVFAADSVAAVTSVVSAPSSNYGLTDEIRAAIKNVAVESTANGVQISATIRVYNGGNTENRLPEHELRVRTAEGLVYTLQPSATNKAALQPKEIGELTYMAVIDSKELTKIDSLSFVNVDVYSYPKVETTLLTMPAANVWYGTGNAELQKLDALSWGQAFTLPGINSGLVYTPVEASMQNTSTSRAAVVTLLAENPGAGRETMPDFRIDGQSELKTYEGTRAEKDAVTLEAGEKKYIHFSIPVENGVNLSNLLVVSTDSFVPKSGGQSTVIDTGKLAFAWPAASEANASATAYTIGAPIAFDALTKVIDSKTQVSLMEMHMHENPGEGYQTVVAKFKLTNTSDVPTAFPAFQTEIVSGSGVTYRGARQANVTSTMNPGLSYVVSYSYIVPQTETGDAFTVKVLDAQAAAPFTTTIASLKTTTQAEEKGSTFSLYPFDLTVNNCSVSYQYAALQYSYKISLDLDIKQAENVVVDNNFSTLRFEIVDGLGRVMGSKDASFTGANKLISGKQIIDASNVTSEQFVSPVSVNVYEVIQTENGTAKRLLENVK